MRSLLLLLACCCLSPLFAAANPHQPRGTEPQTPSDSTLVVAPSTVRAARLGGTLPVMVDGRLDEPAWQQATPISGFRQRDPVQGAAPTEETVVYLLYDDEALYVGARLYDAAPDSIVALLGRRDAELEADRFAVFIDPYFDRRSGFYFGLNAAGTLYDGVLMNDSWDDDSWDGVWEGKARIDDEGWVAELRIPYSQLRFYEKDEYVWGINFGRTVARKNEEIFLVYTPRNESGFVSRFVSLRGIAGVRPPRQVELVPYATTRAAYTGHAPGDPFNDGSSYSPGFGADLKVGLTNNLTLNATVNPDFGQVEVDPAVVNLSDVESFFPEKRPFFVEGAQIFNFGSGGSNSNWNFNFGIPDLFYSRRIGRSAQGGLPSHDYADVPDGARILGAAKLTGKVGGNWNVGMVHAVTDHVMADLAAGDRRFDAEVEPRAYYGVLRGQREIDAGRQGIGFMSTVTQRSFGNDALRDQINESAYAAGVDGWTFLDREKTWVLTGWAGLTSVQGSEARLLNLQQSSLHYFQRPDADHVSVDSNATSMTGYAARFMLNRQRGPFYLNTAFGFVSPSFDVNDLGFMWQTDAINGHLVMGYRWNEPTNYYRRISFNTSYFRTMDFGGNTTWQGVWANSWIQFPNYWSMYTGVAVNPESVNNRRTRGGPLTLNPSGFENFGGVSTDGRKKWVFEGGYYTYQTDAGDSQGLNLSAQWKPAANLSLTLSPNLRWSESKAQYLGTFTDATATQTYGRRYVFGELDQVTFSSSIRMNWTFSPTLSFQLFAQPLISSGDYTRFKELAAPNTFDFNVYGEDGDSTFDPEGYEADPDGDGPAAPISLRNPDFNFKSLRGTAVFRWEYRAGSTLYLVWTQDRSDFENMGEFRFQNSLDRLIEAKPDNVFMVKLTYWLSR